MLALTLQSSCLTFLSCWDYKYEAPNLVSFHFTLYLFFNSVYLCESVWRYVHMSSAGARRPKDYWILWNWSVRQLLATRCGF